MSPAQAPAVQVPPAGAQQPVPATSSARVFASDSGIIFNSVKPESVGDFETVLDRLREALALSTDPTRRAQAAGWKIFKAAEPGPGGSVLYVFVMNPAVKNADYGVAKILAEAFPDEALELYRLYSTAFATGQTLLNLHTVPDSPAPGSRKGAQPASPSPPPVSSPQNSTPPTSPAP